MEACRNKRSKVFFIHIEKLPSKKILLITPDGIIKSLESCLFDEIMEFEESTLLERGLVTERQLAIYAIYRRSKDQEPIEDLELMIKELTGSQRKNLRYQLMRLWKD